VNGSPDSCTLCGGEILGEPLDGSAGETFCSPGCASVAETLDVDTTTATDSREAGATNGQDAPEIAAETDDGSATTRTYLHVDGMHNPTCEQFLESRATDLAGVTAADASYVTGTARVDHDPDAVTPEALCERLSTVGYTATTLDADTDGSRHSGHRAEQSRSKRRAQRSMDEMLGFRYVAGVVFGTFLLLPYVVVLYPVYVSSTFGLSLGAFDQVTGVSDTAMLLPLFLTVSGVVLFFTGLPLLRGAYVSVKTRTANTDLLVTVTILSAYFYGMVALVIGRLDVYFDLTIVIAASVVAAIFYESLMKQRAVDQLTDLTVSQVGQARVREPDGSTSSVPVAEVEAGEELLVTQGERVPVDGTLRGDECTIDEAVVTGESLPVRKEPGDRVVGGSIVTEGAATVDVGRDPTSSIERLTESVWDLHSATHGLQRRVDRLARLIIPAVLVGAALWGVAALVLGDGPVMAVLAVATGVVVLSPWGLGLATPLSVATNIRDALAAGVVVFDETVFERLRETEVVVFDKTGTLTTGSMQVVEADAPPELLAAVAELEGRASHPAAEAIASAFGPAAGGPRADGGDSQEMSDRETGGRQPEIDDFRTHATGVSGTVDGSPILVGHPDLFEERGWSVPGEFERLSEQARERSQLPVVVGQDGQAEGVVVLDDQPREEWTGTLDRLAERGVDAVVLTGDDERSADRFGQHPAVRNVFADVAPGGKTEAVRGLQSEADHVTMVGDGTNDAPALAQADLGIALGSGTALATDAADLALAEDDLTAVETVFDLAGAARRRVARNTGLALLYNAAVLPFAVLGLLNPLVTMCAVVLSAGLVGLNSNRELLL